MQAKGKFRAYYLLLPVFLGVIIYAVWSAEVSEKASACVEQDTLHARVNCYKEISISSLSVSNSELFLEIGADLLAAKEYLLAIRYLSHYIDIDGSDAKAYLMRGIAYSEVDKITDAIEDYTTAIEAGRQDEFIFSERGRLHAKKGNFHNAINDFSKELERTNSFELLEYRGDAYNGIGNKVLAIEDYRSAVENRKRFRQGGSGFSPSEVQLYLKLLKLLKETGRSQEFASLKQEAIRRNPDSLQLQAELGMQK